MARGSDTFGYDQANRLKTASISGTNSTYVYDGDGRRASKTVGGTQTTYTYDANASLLVLLDDGTRKYVWGLGLAFAARWNSTRPLRIRRLCNTNGSSGSQVQDDAGPWESRPTAVSPRYGSMNSHDWIMHATVASARGVVGCSFSAGSRPDGEHLPGWRGTVV